MLTVTHSVKNSLSRAPNESFLLGHRSHKSFPKGCPGSSGIQTHNPKETGALIEEDDCIIEGIASPWHNEGCRNSKVTSMWNVNFNNTTAQINLLGGLRQNVALFIKLRTECDNSFTADKNSAIVAWR